MKVKSTLLVFGDICPVDADNRTLGDSFQSTYLEGLSRIARESDYVIANLEAPVVEELSPINKCGPILHVCPSHLPVLKTFGIQALALANNHVFDHGDKGLMSTFSQLKKHNIEYWGATGGNHLLNNPFLISLNDKKVAIFAFAEREFNFDDSSDRGACVFDPYIHLQAIQSAASTVDYVVVLYHGGIENYVYPSPELQKKCRAMASMGANCILCQHSHCIGTTEHFNGSVILYGQGNTIFGYREDNETWNQGLAVRINPENNSVEFIPIEMTNHGCKVMSESSAGKVLQQFYDRSSIISNKDFIKKEWSNFTRTRVALYLAMLTGKGRVFNKVNRLCGNLFLSMLLNKTKLRTMLNLMRCAAHREVAINIIEKQIEKK